MNKTENLTPEKAIEELHEMALDDDYVYDISTIAIPAIGRNMIAEKPTYCKHMWYKCPACNRRLRSGKGSSCRIADNFCQINTIRQCVDTNIPVISVMNGIIATVEAQPIADVEPVMRGKWNVGFDGDGFVYECNVCKEIFYEIDGENIDSVSDFKYCPNCGAKMEGANDG